LVDVGRNFSSDVDRLVADVKRLLISGRLSVDDANDLISAAPAESLKAFREYFLCCRIHDMPGYLPDLNDVLREVRSAFQAPISISASASEKMLREAEGQLRTFSNPKKGDKEWQNKFDRVRATLSPIIQAVPPRAECVRRLLQLPSELLASLLIVEYSNSKDG